MTTDAAQATPERPARVRDPDRRTKILAVAARLFASQGFHPVSLTDIGREAGIVGSGVYRHFDSKVAVLVALLDQALDGLLERTDAIVAAHHDPDTTMQLLIDTQIEFCLDERLQVQLYRAELTAIDAEDSRRLRRLQRRYNEEWVSTLLDLRPGLGEIAARALVHAAIGAIQSCVTYDSGLSRDDEVALLHDVAERVLLSSGT